MQIPREAVGRRLTDLIVPEEAKEEAAGRAERVAHGQRVESEVVRRRKDGTRLEALAASVPVSLPHGGIVAYDAHLDVTARKEADALLKTLSRRMLTIQENERQHLARELHDEIGQLLTGSTAIAESQRRLASQRRQDSIRPGAEHGRRPSHQSAQALVRSAADLDQLGLLPALMSFFERFTEQTGVLVNFKHKGLDGRLRLMWRRRRIASCRKL